MKKIMKKIIALALVLVILSGLVVPVSAAGVSTEEAGRLLDSFTANGDTFTLSADSRIFVVSDSAPRGDLLETVQLVQRQFAAAGRPGIAVMPIVWGPESYAWEGDIIAKLDSSTDIDADGYELDITTKAKVTASDTDGLLYGLNMLLKHMEYAGSNSICGFSAKDEPDTIERTVHLDCGRKYFTKEWICNFIRQISWMGYNALEFHFSEDGGFRADFWDSKYYTGVFQPKNDFSWICGSQPQSWVIEESTINGTTTNYKNDPDKGKYLTTSELVEICDTAAQYHIEIIPSFDSPAHLDYLTWRFEQYYESQGGYSFEFNGKPYTAEDACINYTNYSGTDSEATWPNYSAINIIDPFTKHFIFALYTDVANFFKEYAGSKNFNIGADEVNLTYTETWEFDDFHGYVNELDDMLNELGYTTRIFNDFIGSTAHSSKISNFNSDIEILYWNSPWDPNNGSYRGTDNQTLPATDFSNNNRVMYNVIQTGTYYCTRITGTDWTWSNMDARDPDNRQWRVYNATETGIYNDWNPKDFGEKGVCDETVDIPAEKIAGAYFCLWHDFAALNTEKEIWYGATDKANSSKIYYLFDRMWSNTIKMWNWDINSSVAYSEFSAVAEKFGDFPGLTEGSSGCSKKASLPAATAATQATLADHSELTEVLANKVESAPYTDVSYAAYEVAYSAAQEVNENPAATAEEIKKALDDLASAKAALMERGKVVEVIYKVKQSADVADSDAVLLEIEEFLLESGSYSIYIAPRKGYTFQKASGATFDESESGDGSGYIKGTSQYGVTVTLYYLNTPSTVDLEFMVQNAETNGSLYTAESWAAYQQVLEKAKAFAIDETTNQSHVDSMIQALREAEQALVADHTGESKLGIEKLTETARYGRKIGLKITTSPNVKSLSFGDKTPTLCISNMQTLSNGELVKLWLVYIPADTLGTQTITVIGTTAADTVTGSLDITVK